MSMISYSNHNFVGNKRKVLSIMFAAILRVHILHVPHVPRPRPPRPASTSFTSHVLHVPHVPMSLTSPTSLTSTSPSPTSTSCEKRPCLFRSSFWGVILWDARQPITPVITGTTANLGYTPLQIGILMNAHEIIFWVFHLYTVNNQDPLLRRYDWKTGNKCFFAQKVFSLQNYGVYAGLFFFSATVNTCPSSLVLWYLFPLLTDYCWKRGAWQGIWCNRRPQTFFTLGIPS